MVSRCAVANRLLLAKKGEEINQTTIVAPQQTALVRVTGDLKTGEPVRGLRFLNLSFVHCLWEIPQRGYAEGQATKHDPRDGLSKPGFIAHDTSRDRIGSGYALLGEQCSIQHLGTSGIWFVASAMIALFVIAGCSISLAMESCWVKSSHVNNPHQPNRHKRMFDTKYTTRKECCFLVWTTLLWRRGNWLGIYR